MNSPEPALTAAGTRLLALALHAILHNANETTNPQDVPGGGPCRLQETLKDVLRGPGPLYPGGDQASRRSLAGARQIQSLAEAAREINYGEVIGRGGEHLVFRRRGDHEVFKLTLPDVYGYGFVTDVDRGLFWNRPALASEYIARIGLLNAAFGVETTIDAVAKNPGGSPQIGTRQAWIDGTIPQSAEVAEWLCAQNFFIIAREFHDRGTVPDGSIWYRPSDNLLLGDAAPRNFILTPDGLIVPIDVSLTLMPEALMPPQALVGL